MDGAEGSGLVLARPAERERAAERYRAALER